MLSSPPGLRARRGFENDKTSKWDKTTLAMGPSKKMEFLIQGEMTREAVSKKIFSGDFPGYSENDLHFVMGVDIAVQDWISDPDWSTMDEVRFFVKFATGADALTVGKGIGFHLTTTALFSAHTCSGVIDMNKKLFNGFIYTNEMEAAVDFAKNITLPPNISLEDEGAVYQQLRKISRMNTNDVENGDAKMMIARVREFMHGHSARKNKVVIEKMKELMGSSSMDADFEQNLFNDMGNN